MAGITWPPCKYVQCGSLCYQLFVVPKRYKQMSRLIPQVLVRKCKSAIMSVTSILNHKRKHTVLSKSGAVRARDLCLWWFMIIWRIYTNMSFLAPLNNEVQRVKHIHAHLHLYPNISYTCRWLTLQCRHNERDGVPNHQHSDCLLNRFSKAQIRENIKVQRHWSLWVEFTGDRWIPRTKGQ